MSVRLTCPACATALELDEGDAGGLVRCGRCGEVFAASHAAPRPSVPTPHRWADDPPRRPPARPSRHRDDEDEDDWDRPRRRRRPPEGDGAATAALVLGILSLFLFCPWPLGMVVSGVGLALGAMGLKSRARRSAVAGLVLSAVGLTFAVGFAVLTVAAVVKQSADRPAPPNHQNRVLQP